MNAAFSIVEALGCRFRPHQAPRGTPSRIIKLRLANSLRRAGRCLSIDSALQPARVPGSSSPFPSFAAPTGTIRAQDTPSPTKDPEVGDAELGLLREILALNHPSRAGIKGEPRFGLNQSALSTTHTADQPIAATTFPSSPSSDLLRAFRNTRKTFEYLKAATATSPAPAQEVTFKLQGAIADLPPSTFSELLRSLDPVAYVSKEMDPAEGVHVGPGMAQYTDLGRVIDEFGVRRIYFWLLRRLVAVAQVRIEAGHGLLQSDYKILLRCAGAASDLHMAKKIWHLMETRGQISLRDGDAYTEFIKARFLTEALYTQFDMARFRVSPGNMHKQKIWLAPRQLSRIRKLRYNIVTKQAHRFGQNRYTPEKAEGLVRILRKTKPIRKVFLKVVKDGVAVDEKLLCSAMVAFARNGALQFIKVMILSRYWKIKVNTVKATREVTVSGGTTVYRPDSPMHPTARLLDAVVESFCCNAEIATAFKLLDFISNRYGIPIPDKTWFKLLEWAYVQSSRPASLEWKLAGWPEKTVRQDTVQLIWDTMVSEPYNVRPGFNEHIILIKSLLSRGRLKDAMQRMLELQPAYAKTLVDLEDAFYEHVHTSRLGIDPAQSLQRWLGARTQKQMMWYAIQTCCWKLFKKVRSNRIDDIMTVRLIPQLIDAFRPFFARSLRYRTATGVVEIRNPNPVALFESGARNVRLPALITQDLVGVPRPQGVGAGGADGLSSGSADMVSRSTRPDPDTSKVWRRQSVRVGHNLASKVLPKMLRQEMPSAKQLLREFV